jgi:hypothetical protein
VMDSDRSHPANPSKIWVVIDVTDVTNVEGWPRGGKSLNRILEVEMIKRIAAGDQEIRAARAQRAQEERCASKHEKEGGISVHQGY